jgi:hypothetical protein
MLTDQLIETQRAHLVRRRVELNQTIATAALCRNAVPCLGPTAPLQWWRRHHQSPFNATIRRARRELASIAKLIGPAPKFWKERPAPGLERMRRLFKLPDGWAGTARDERGVYYLTKKPRVVAGRPKTIEPLRIAA